jgi:multidrug efflux system outer membrane protein
VAATAAVLAGCASLQGGARDTMDDAPAAPPSWSTPAAPAAAAEPVTPSLWWQQFADPRLAALVDEATVRSTDVRTAQARLLQARAARSQAAAALSPTLSGGASAQASRREGASTSTRSVGAELDGGWSPDLSGGHRAGVTAADADMQASQASLAQTRVAVTTELALSYIDLRNAQARLAIAQDNLASQEETLQITRWRVQAGLASTLDSDQAESAAAQTRAQLPALRTAIAQSANAIAVLVGRVPGELNDLRDAAPLPQPRADLALAMPAQVLRQRADVQAAEARVRAAAARVQQADAQRLPSLDIGGSIGLNALALTRLGSGAGLASLAASVSVPLLDGGRIRAQVQGQEAAWDEARSSYRATVLAALQDVEDALVAIEGARAQQAELATAVAAARRAAELAQTRYEAGLVDFLTVLTTRRTLLQLEDSAAGAAANLASQHVRLVQSLGGGWTSSTTS